MSEFRAAGYRWRLYAGLDALRYLPTEIERAGAERAFVICGRTVATTTDLPARIGAAIGDRLAGVFDEMGKDCPHDAVAAATRAAQDAGADLLIAVGGGSVMAGTRGVAVFLGEPGDPFALMTQYPDGRLPVSPRLEAPKLPILNVPTTPTTAMNRAGAALRNDALGRRMEYFDPKTRPAALFWDHGALLTAPVDLVRSAGTTTLTAALDRAASRSDNPLQAADSAAAFVLARRALPAAIADPADADPRVELCTAAFLVDRAEDDGGPAVGTGSAWRVAYGLATALHLRYPHVGQGEATAAVFPAALRHEAVDSPYSAAVAAALTGSDTGGTESAASAVEDLYRSLGMAVRLRDLDVPQDQLATVAATAGPNFGANQGRVADDDADRLHALLRAAW